MRTRRKRKKSNIKIIPIVGLVFLRAVIWVWKSTEAHKLSRQLTELENAQKTLIEDNKLLRAELLNHRSISYIDKCVRQRYGMTYDVKERMVLIDNPDKKSNHDRSLFVSLGNNIVDFIRKMLE